MSLVMVGELADVGAVPAVARSFAFYRVCVQGSHILTVDQLVNDYMLELEQLGTREYQDHSKQDKRSFTWLSIAKEKRSMLFRILSGCVDLGMTTAPC